VWQLSVGEQQRVEILRALFRDARILILDEPTATLTPVETERLFPKLRALATEGASIVFITHHLEDVLRWADRITVLRQGEVVGSLSPVETSAEELARLMVGRDVTLMNVAAGRRALSAGGPDDGAAPPVLEVNGLSAEGDRGTPALDDVGFKVGAGEIVSIVGVEGNGQSELEEVLYGLRRHAREPSHSTGTTSRARSRASDCGAASGSSRRIVTGAGSSVRCPSPTTSSSTASTSRRTAAG